MKTADLRRLLEQASAARKQLKAARIEYVRRTYKRVLADRTGKRLLAAVNQMVELGLYAKSCVETDRRAGYISMAWRVDTGFQARRWGPSWDSDPNYLYNWAAKRGFTARGVPTGCVR